MRRGHNEERQTGEKGMSFTRRVRENREVRNGLGLGFIFGFIQPKEKGKGRLVFYFPNQQREEKENRDGNRPWFPNWPNTTQLIAFKTQSIDKNNNFIKIKQVNILQTQQD